MLGDTRIEMQEKLREGAAWIAAALVGMGVALSLTIILVSAGMKLILVGTSFGLAGWGLAAVLPRFCGYDEIRCPRCFTNHEVRHHINKFACEGCGNSLYGQGFWKQGTGRHKNRVLLTGNKCTIIAEKSRQTEKESRIQ